MTNNQTWNTKCDKMENSVNLNLINLLILLKKHRSMRVVAKILGKSESAISKDLSKLRNEFSDNLFIKTQSGFEATHYLEQIYPELESTYLKLISIVNKPIEFQPQQYDELITIAIAEAEYEHIITSLYPQLIEQFPKAKLKFITWNYDSVDKMRAGEITCGIHLQNERFSKDLYQKALQVEKMVAAVHKRYQIKHWDEIKKLPFVFIDVPAWNELNYQFKEVLPKVYSSDILYNVRVDRLKSALDIATQSKVALQIPANYLTDDFSIVPYPENIDFKIAYSFYCLQTEKNNPLVQILQKLISGCYVK